MSVIWVQETPCCFYTDFPIQDWFDATAKRMVPDFIFEGIAERLLREKDWYLFRVLWQGTLDLEQYVEDFSDEKNLMAGLNGSRANVLVESLLLTATIPPVQAPTLDIWSTHRKP
jgi:hypothetical protein